jgi:putative transposase
MPTKEPGWKRRFGDASFYIWRAMLGGRDVSEARRLKDLEAESVCTTEEAAGVVQALEQIVGWRGRPMAIRCDNALNI